MSVRLCCLAVFIAMPAFADISLHKLFSNGAVVQRNQSIPLQGYASEEKSVDVYLDDILLGSTTVTAKRWQYILPATSAGGPHTLRIEGGGNSTSVQDLYFGDVWLLAGQSNMELTMSRVEEAFPEDISNADFPLIREFTVPDTYDFDGPREDYTEGKWLTATSANIRQLSAVGYYFAKNLNEELGIPIGLINASLGGSPIESWMSPDALSGFPEALNETQPFKDDSYVAAIKNSDAQRQQVWYTMRDAMDLGFKENWKAGNYDDRDWESVNLPAYLPGTNEDSNFAGVWWVRREFELNKKPDAPVVIRLGRIVDADAVYINGTFIGETTYQYPPRRYEADPSLFQKGKNLIAVRVTSVGADTQFVADKPYFMTVGDTKISLDGKWKYQAAATLPPLMPQTFIRWKPTGLYHAMIAPALRFPLTGALWYQGESNTKSPALYNSKLSTMIEDWRQRWGQSFPFITIQLTNFMERSDIPSDTAWASLRAQQWEVSQTVPDVATVISIDVGEWNDIHPVNKKAVGFRASLAARALAYGEKIDYQGPVVTSAKLEDDELILTFSDAALPLRFNGASNRSFAVGTKEGAFSWAVAHLKGNNQVVLSGFANTEPNMVRYGWGNNPEATLTDASGLPAPPFKINIE
ncbi:sialate O-acetylesterase [Alteromonas confluentis]|uniref:Sialate O-acetylesterase domain-containing protein n=1 Tax=Alteromonas confluentis TaxID=1656094 RepID=A0A1E7Z7Y4_9ALTE|nr:sialate O-acetylesterase [Alteromonas confluentis]OFC69630.1 hypothetical protein BFC18_16270 [Alteromonas confluentis]